MATEKWIAGTTGSGLTWASLDTTALNSLASGNALLSGTQIDNSTNLDVFCDVEVVLASLAAAAPSFVGLFFYPLNSDASTYGEGLFGSAAAGPPASQYSVGSIAYATGTSAKQGMLRGILLPPAKGKFVVWNQMGVAFASSGNTLKYRTYNRAIA